MTVSKCSSWYMLKISLCILNLYTLKASVLRIGQIDWVHALKPLYIYIWIYLYAIASVIGQNDHPIHAPRKVASISIKYAASFEIGQNDCLEMLILIHAENQPLYFKSIYAKSLCTKNRSNWLSTCLKPLYIYIWIYLYAIASVIGQNDHPIHAPRKVASISIKYAASFEIGQNDCLGMLNIFICQSLCKRSKWPSIHASASISISQYNMLKISLCIFIYLYLYTLEPRNRSNWLSTCFKPLYIYIWIYLYAIASVIGQNDHPIHAPRKVASISIKYAASFEIGQNDCLEMLILIHAENQPLYFKSIYAKSLCTKNRSNWLSTCFKPLYIYIWIYLYAIASVIGQNDHPIHAPRKVASISIKYAASFEIGQNDCLEMLILIHAENQPLYFKSIYAKSLCTKNRSNWLSTCFKPLYIYIWIYLYAIASVIGQNDHPIHAPRKVASISIKYAASFEIGQNDCLELIYTC